MTEKEALAFTDNMTAEEIEATEDQSFRSMLMGLLANPGDEVSIRYTGEAFVLRTSEGSVPVAHHCDDDLFGALIDAASERMLRDDDELASYAPTENCVSLPSVAIDIPF